MTHRAIPGPLHFKKFRPGFSLLELAVGLGLMIILSAVLVSSGQREAAKTMRVLQDLNALSEASVKYQSRNCFWPGQLADLKPDFLPGDISLVNPWGNAYTVGNSTYQVIVATVVPSGKVQKSLVGPQVIISNSGAGDSISMSRILKRNTRMEYDKKYIYGE